MKLSKERFSKGPCRFRTPGKIDVEGTLYTYESQKDIFDIVILNGMKYYQKNMRGYSNRIDVIEPIHCEIERHYNI